MLCKLDYMMTVNPFVLCRMQRNIRVFEKLRKMIDTDYFEKLIDRIFYKQQYSQISGNT